MIRTRLLPIRRLGVAMLAATLFTAGMTSPAFADVYGRLHFTVKDVDTDKPLSNASITLHDSAGVRADITVTTDTTGTALSPQLEIRPWQITSKAVGYLPDTRTVTVAADTQTEVEVVLEPQKEQVITIKGVRTLVHPSQPQNSTPRDLNFIQQIPATGGNPQSLQRETLTVPGFVSDSVNQAHPRGEHGSTTLYLNGFQLPGALQGRAGQVLVPDTIQSAEILTGGYPAEYGGETAAILNLNLRSGTIRPFQDFTLEGGTYSTLDGILTLGGQLGAPIGPPVEGGERARRFGYLVSANSRYTNNALEPPQPDNQTAHNGGTSSDFFGNFDYHAGPRDQITLTLNEAPASTDIANRTGLPAEFAPVGQGFGFGGARNADGTIPGGDPTAPFGGPMVLPSQQAAGQDVFQDDDNRFALVNYRHGFSDRLTGLFSVGATHSGLDINNKNPAVALTDAGLPPDSSIELNPTINRKSNDVEVAGSISLLKGKHTFKGGLIDDEQSGDESYQLIPGSHIALDALEAQAPILAPVGPGGAVTTQTDATDVLGYPVAVLPAGATSPVLNVHRSGYYRAAYIQDNWVASPRFTANYGLRLDSYSQSQNLGQPSISLTTVSPRVNLAYAVTKLTIARVSYNHLFTEPPLAQGAILGTPIHPETLDQYDASLERQLFPGQTAKIAYYYKHIENQIDTGLLIPFTQIGAYTSVTFSHGAVHGLELSYDVRPRGNTGTGGYVSYTYSIAQPNGVDNTGGQAPQYNDHDQRHTLSAGVDYTLRSGASAAADVYYGSGVASSSIASAFFPIALNNGDRVAHTVVNLRFGSPEIQRVGSLQLIVENLFDDRSVVNFNSGFSGTRFVQGRRVLLSLKKHF